MSSIKDAYKEAEIFHNLGGNLKSVENYLNSQLDETLKKQHLAFYSYNSSDGSTPPGSRVSEWVREMAKASDIHKKGGYGNNLPGLILPRREEGYRGIDNRWFEDMPRNFLSKNDQLRSIRSMNDKRLQRFDVMEPVEGFQRWKAAMGPISDICKNVNLIGGGKGYDDKFMCSFDELKNESSFSIHNDSECNIMSIGSNGEWGFEKTISDTTICSTHTFDCTVGKPNKPKKDSIHFYHYCIADENKKIGDHEYLTYYQMMKIAGIHNAPTLFKMDVEGFEYDVMTQIIVKATETKSTNELPSQISVELHYGTKMYDLPWLLRLRQAGEIAMFTGMMYRAGGYLPVHVKYDNGCDACVEILFVHVLCDE